MKRLTLTLLTILAGASATAHGAPVAPAEPREVLSSHRVFVDTGIDLHYVARYPSRATTPGKALVLLHGYSESWRSFEEVLTAIDADQLGMPVYALDLRGHGTSSDGGNASIPGMAADVICLCPRYEHLIDGPGRLLDGELCRTQGRV